MFEAFGLEDEELGNSKLWKVCYMLANGISAQ